MTIHHTARNGSAVLELPAVRPIDELECTAILARHDVGRLAIVEGNELDIFPVRYVVDGHWAIVSVPPEVDLSQASLDRLALEVDEIDGDGERTIVIHGSGRNITASLDETSVRERTSVESTEEAASGAHAVRIIPRLISGRETPARTC
jgi:nitroimidazol reductase NimA-like FMN-containing flavoprotein (pyridoxamine 5'-phosphate oxidase superfamily)